MKKHDPEEVQQMRESLLHFQNTVRTLSKAQSKLRESFAPASPEVMERLYIPPPPKSA